MINSTGSRLEEIKLNVKYNKVKIKFDVWFI